MTQVTYMVSVISSIVMVFLNSLFLYFTYELEKQGCECAMNWQRMFMMISLLVFITYSLFLILAMRVPVWAALGMLALMISYVIITRNFIIKMKHESCKCATSNKIFKILDVFNWVQIVLLTIWIILAITIVIMSISNAQPGLQQPRLQKPKMREINARK
jgi:hypothetical protein